MTDQPAEGTHILYQDVTVPAGASLSIDVFIANRAGPFRTPASLSFTVGPNQQARNGILAAFVHEVEAQTDKSITPADAVLLIGAARSLMAP